MIQDITFSDKPIRTIAHETCLPSLKGKTFEFRVGLNVIVGANGCGKTSLLNVIRYLTMCDGTFSSNIARGHSEWQMHRRNVYEGGYFQNVKLRADYKNSVWNLRKKGDVKDYEWMSSTENFSDRMSHKSDGESVKRSIMQMLAYMMYGYDKTMEKKIENGVGCRSFSKSVLDELHNISEQYKKGGIEDDKNIWLAISNYYDENKVDFKGITMLLDEPDKGMDVDNVTDLYDWLVTDTTKGKGMYQTICVLHNIGMIHRLMREGVANFIELSEGYLEKVEGFFDDLK